MNRYSFAVQGERRRRKRPHKESPAQLLVEGGNLFSGSEPLRAYFNTLTSMELDLLRVAGAVFAADRASARGERESLSRHISVRIPVNNLEFFLERTRDLEILLRELSQDVWQLSFAHREEESGIDDEPSFPDAPGRTLLFSGGLDSLAAAVEFSAGDLDLLLVSHATRNPVNSRAQKDLISVLKDTGRKFEHIQVFVSSRDSTEPAFVHDAEPSQRTRSFVFLTLGAICARRKGRSELVYMAENGQMAIHLPLTSARIGAFSTRTAHPKVLRQAESFLASALTFGLKIANPYVYLTKAEVVAKIAAVVPASIELSTSCWKNARVVALGATHCGECVPCIMRRISIEVHVPDKTAYARDVLSESLSEMSAEDDGRRNLCDLAEFAFLMQSLDDDSMQMEFPELISDVFDPSRVIDMYRRFAAEARHILAKYPGMAPLIS